MRHLLAALALLSALLLGATLAAAQSPKRPWEADAKLSEAVMKDAQSKGIMAVRSRVTKLEKALADAPAAYAAAAAGDGDTTYVLTDGTTDTLISIIGAAAAAENGGKKGNVAAVNNPYPLIAFMLGSYYVETGALEDAVRVLDVGLNLPSTSLLPGETRPLLLNERATALGQLKRFPEALAGYEALIAIDDLEPTMMARGLRGRGITLIDLGRLDEAEADLVRSLQFQPGHPVVANELAYIAKLRGGGKPTDTVVQMIQPAP